MIRLRPSGADGVLIKRIIDWYDPGPGVFISNPISVFSPASLFSAGEVGAWYDPSDYTTLFQDSAGTTPVTTVEQPVGLMLDKSKGLVLGSELVTNGDFSNGTTGWSPGTGWTISGGSASFNNATGASLSQTGLPTMPAGRWYQLEFDLTFTSGNGCTVGLNVGGGIDNFGTFGSSGHKKAVVLTTVARSGLQITGIGGSVFSIDNISVKELPGNHAFQATSANRPVLSARVNLLTKTEDFSNAVWVKNSSTVAADVTTAPNGTTTADSITATGTSNAYMQQTTTQSVLTSYTFSVYIKANTAAWAIVVNAAIGGGAWFNLSNGTVGTKQAGVTSATIQSTGNGWYLCTISGTTPASIATNVVGLYAARADNSTTTVVGDSVYYWGADLRVSNDGVGIPAYQRVNTSTDYDTTGFPLYLKFNGTNSSLATNSINFTATDKMTAWMGVRRLLSGSEQIVVELSSTYLTPGSFSFNAISYSGLNYSAFMQGGTSGSSTVINTDVVNPPNTSVATFQYVQAATSSISIRTNGSQTGSATGNAVGTFANAPLYIGARYGNSKFLNGQIYSLIVRGAQSSASQITQTETWVDGKTYAY